MLKYAELVRLKAMGSPRTRTIIGVAVIFVGGFLLRGCFGSHDMAAPTPTAESAVASPTVWTCSMHPQIQSPKPGKCPLCGMDLIPLVEGGGSQGPRTFAVTKESAEMMNIQTVPVARKFVDAEIRMVGKVAYDETRLTYITAWVPGRLDKLYVDYTGVKVNEGDHMVFLYSPELISAQEELRQAKNTSANFAEGAGPGKTALATLQAARERLRLWGLTPDQIATAEGGEFSDHITIYAPVGGTVIERNGREGMYVETGTRIYSLADLDEMWVMFDAYESDIPWLRYGQHVEFTTEAYQGERFEGMIAFIDPFLDPKTRTAKVRVNVSNKDGKLKPEMFARGTVHSRVAEGGRVADPALAGKWVGPMHPEIVSDVPGDCPICGMKLVPATELGYVASDDLEAAKPLVIPVTAALVTGARAVVYVQVPDMEKPTFEGREIVLGPRAGDYYLVHSGLSEGELVVVNGNFKIDSALQILAKPSMMQPDESDDDGELHDGHGDHQRFADIPAFQGQLSRVYDAYLQIQEALAADTLKAATAAVVSMKEALGLLDMTLLEGEAHMAWMPLAKGMDENLAAMSAVADLEAIRPPFEALSAHLTTAIRQFGLKDGAPVFIVHCPMALDGKGANWLQSTESIANPYYGAAMLNCGDVVEQLETTTESSPAADATPTPRFDGVPLPFQEQLAGVYRAYLPLHAALAADDADTARTAGSAALEAVKAVDMKLLEGETHMAWMPLVNGLEASLSTIVAATEIETMRGTFADVASQMSDALRQFGQKDGPPAFLAHCPMALDGKGANWLQSTEEVTNPYYGAAMLKCGDIVEEINSVVAQ